MPFPGLKDFISFLEKHDEIIRIKTFVDPELEITEITDRIVKNKGKALLFENNGTSFPVLINAFGSEKRMAAALGKNRLGEVQEDFMKLLSGITGVPDDFLGRLKSLPGLIRISRCLPYRSTAKGLCQQIIIRNPDLAALPVLKCWPHDGERFITLPMVHTRHPLTGSANVGMYRMQVLDSCTTAMHWQRHKTGANHFEAWKKEGRRMPVSVALGGDPAYTWAATAPLPENIDEYILAGFVRKKRVKLVRCITNDIWVPSDADIIIEGYVDPSEEMVWEGPFGDHTGFYSLADWYPKFHVTCITHSAKAVYPATIVGIPPHEDAWFTKATEKIFLYPVKMAIQPEIEDFHMPDPGVAHNLVIVRIKKSFPGQGRKVLSSLMGAGQMMFTKYMVVVSGDIDIRDYPVLVRRIFENTDLRTDLMFSSGPLDVLDHSSDVNSLGGKLGIDATDKLEEEMLSRLKEAVRSITQSDKAEATEKYPEKMFRRANLLSCVPVLILGLDQTEEPSVVDKAVSWLKKEGSADNVRLVIAVDHTVDIGDLFTLAWQVLGNSDPVRDTRIISDKVILIDGTAKALRPGGFPRRWPNIVTSDPEVIKKIDEKWESLGIGPFLPSPSSKYSPLILPGSDEVVIKHR